MPIYEFECTNEDCEANLRYEKEMSIHEPHDPKCAFCHSSMQKIYTSVPVHFRAKGFYSTDQ